ncbi:MAG: hypothetical protein HY939_03230 [Gammaproteobacteria bacterium]|nr:hypothetical protein [Gammaproteobacteria bacterium]
MSQPTPSQSQDQPAASIATDSISTGPCRYALFSHGRPPLAPPLGKHTSLGADLKDSGGYSLVSGWRQGSALQR